MNEIQIKQSKMQIQSLAELCINQIYENKFLEDKKTRFNEYLHFIKSILINKNNHIQLINYGIIKGKNEKKSKNEKKVEGQHLDTPIENFFFWISR